MNQTSEFRLGIIGLGGIADAHGPAIQRSAAAIQWAAGCDVRPDAVKKWTGRYPIFRSSQGYGWNLTCHGG